LLGKRMKYLNDRLAKVSSQRAQSRQARKKADIPTVSLVGYTNAGKSTLFNALTESNAYVADKLFATLDPTLRKLEIDDQLTIIMADTVGFIRHLPHDLVAAFRATMLETREADLILHVVDCADESRHEKIEAVNRVLEEIDAAQVPQIMIYNKIDLPGFKARIDSDEQGLTWRVWLSAINRQGFDLLFGLLRSKFSEQQQHFSLRLKADEGEIRGFLFNQGAIDSEAYQNNGDIDLKLHISPSLLGQLHRKYKLIGERLVILTDTLAGAA